MVRARILFQLNINFFTQNDISNASVSLFSYFRDLYFHSHSNQHKRNFQLRMLWTYPKKKTSSVESTHFLKKKNYFAVFLTKSRFRSLFFRFFRTSETFFSIQTLTNSKNFSLRIFLLYREKNYFQWPEYVNYEEK